MGCGVSKALRYAKRERQRMDGKRKRRFHEENERGRGVYLGLTLGSCSAWPHHPGYRSGREGAGSSAALVTSSVPINRRENNISDAEREAMRTHSFCHF